MTGTIVNIFAVVAGSMVGLLLRKGIPQRLNDAVLQIEGLCIVLVGLNGVIGSMFTVDAETGGISSSGELILFISLTLGCLIGELLRIDDRMNNLGLWVEKKLNAQSFAKGFVTATLLYCVGAMTVMGSINDGLTGDYSILVIKSAMDGTMSIMLSAALGIGVLFSAVSVLVIQGGLSLSAQWLAPFITDQLMDMVCMVGYAIVLAIGCNFLFKTKVKTANLLPAMLIPVVYYFIAGV